MQKWWLTHNHLGTVHAIASCNLAEYAMGVLAEAAVPASHRWIPIGMDVRYLATAKSSVTAEAEFATPPAFGPEKEDVTVEVTIRDDAGQEAVHASIRLRISARKVAA
jgi:acyl-coenzyme A thioesterase PaaI-like protein